MSSVESKTYYELLGLTPEASKEEIKTAYKEIARIFHPDSHFYDEILGAVEIPSTSGIADEKTFKIITAAYNTLINDELRRNYDALLPKGLRDWDDRDIRDDWRPPWKGTPQDSATGGMHRSGSYAFGVFGVMGQQPSAFDQAAGVQSVSEVLKKPRFGLLRWLKGLIGR